MDREFLQAASAQYHDNAKMVATLASKVSEPEFAKIYERIATAQKRLEDEINILTNIADKLFGQRPEGDEVAGPIPHRSGRVGEALDGLDDLHERLSRLTSAVNRFNGLVYGPKLFVYSFTLGLGIMP